MNLRAIIKIRQNCNVYLMQGGFLNWIIAHQSGPADLGTDRYWGPPSFLPHPEVKRCLMQVSWKYTQYSACYIVRNDWLFMLHSFSIRTWGTITWGTICPPCSDCVIWKFHQHHASQRYWAKMYTNALDAWTNHESINKLRWEMLLQYNEKMNKWLKLQ